MEEYQRKQDASKLKNADSTKTNKKPNHNYFVYFYVKIYHEK